MPSVYSARWPRNLSTRPLARNRYTVPDAPGAATSTLVESNRASDIWLASIRCQMRRYSRSWSRLRWR